MSDIQETSRKVFIVTKNEVDDHKVVAVGMDWCQLANIIIDLELEKHEFKECLKKSELKKYNTLLDIYQDEKKKRIGGSTNWNPYH